MTLDLFSINTHLFYLNEKEIIDGYIVIHTPKAVAPIVVDFNGKNTIKGLIVDRLYLGEDKNGFDVYLMSGGIFRNY